MTYKLDNKKMTAVVKGKRINLDTVKRLERFGYTVTMIVQ